MPDLRQRDGDQPLPVAGNGPVIADLVASDIADRKRLGIQRYGTPLQPFNGRDALRDLYEELLDASHYARQAIWERDHPIEATVPGVDDLPDTTDSISNDEAETSATFDLTIGEVRELEAARPKDAYSAAYRLRATLDRHAARGSSVGEYDGADVRAVLDNREQWRTLAMACADATDRVAEAEAELKRWQQSAMHFTEYQIAAYGDFGPHAKDRWVVVLHRPCEEFVFGQGDDDDSLDASELVALVATHQCPTEAPGTASENETVSQGRGGPRSVPEATSCPTCVHKKSAHTRSAGCIRCSCQHGRAGVVSDSHPS